MIALGKKLFLSTLAGLGLLVSLNAAANAAQETFVFSGVTCDGLTSTDAAKLVFNAYGVMNNASTPAMVTCPMPTRPNQFVAAVNVKGYDRNTGSGIDCELDVMDF